MYNCLGLYRSSRACAPYSPRSTVPRPLVTLSNLNNRRNVGHSLPCARPTRLTPLHQGIPKAQDGFLSVCPQADCLRRLDQKTRFLSYLLSFAEGAPPFCL